MRKIGFILNKSIRNKSHFYRDLQRAQKIFAATYDFEIAETTAPESAIILAKKFANQKTDIIVAIGGDGTINEVINGVMHVDHFEGYLSLLPYGTANDFCKSITAPRSISDLIEAYEQQQVKTVDIGSITYQKLDGSSHHRYFINIADLGMGADVVQRVNRSKKRLGANMTFMKAIVQTFWHYKNRSVKIETENWQWEGKINTIAIANGKYFGSGLCIAPEATVDDKSFEVVIIGDVSLKDYLKNVNQLKRGNVIDHPQVFYKKATSISVRGVGEPCAIECDGEYLGETPVTIKLAKNLYFIIKQNLVLKL